MRVLKGWLPLSVDFWFFVLWFSVGCVPKVPVHTSREQAIMDTTVTAWRMQGLRYDSETCGYIFSKLQIEERPSLENQGGYLYPRVFLDPGYSSRLLVHELWHVLHHCNGLPSVHSLGDPGHVTPFWGDLEQAAKIKVEQEVGK